MTSNYIEGSIELKDYFKDITCEKCNKRPAKLFWALNREALNNGRYEKWCKVCVLEEEIKHIEDKMLLLPQLKIDLEK